jgi:hypothetical protein
LERAVVGALEALGLAARSDGPDVATRIAAELAVPVDALPVEGVEQVREAQALELDAAPIPAFPYPPRSRSRTVVYNSIVSLRPDFGPWPGVIVDPRRPAPWHLKPR